MIEVMVRDDHIRISGHAGYAGLGKDIVCAGVSVLVQTLVKSINDLTDDRPEQEIVPGTFYMNIKNLSEQGKFLVDSFFIGICGIAEAYPDSVRVI